MKISKLILLSFLLYCSTSCEKSTVQPEYSGANAKISSKEELDNSTVALSTSTTVYKYYGNNGIRIMLPTAYMYGSIYNSKGLVAKIPPIPPSPCSPTDKNCPTYKPIITVNLSAVYKIMTISIPNNPYSKKVQYNLTGTTSLLNFYYPSSTFTAYQY